ncbi:LysR family transcriptional regulator [Variovorax sp. J22P168]|uniref:LysR family transcriptional regulator n=1 Tax=Variovorax jilinensis TaxID=3053513 RepID=UPI00257855C1|nr:LysR family transcriptional regulator [Variovorax sp. J22P168]MDM0012749.1 LysR family transcriptional regulator [Variovorax sp. J22P168]
MRLRHIEVFNAIMLTGSVSAAARLINITQPAVSRTLQHAEIQLGFPLFQRTKGRLAPTNEALALYPHIERLFAQLDEVQRLAANLRTASDAGELRILSVLALSYEVLPRALKRFREQHPAIAVTLESLHSPQIMSALLLQEADVGFAFSPVVHPSLTQEALADSRIVCIAPRGMLPRALLRNGSVALHDLVKLPVVGLDSRDPVGTSLSQACRQAGVGFQAVVTVQTYHAALAMAHHGLGVALVDGCTAYSADRDKVDVLTLEPHIPVPIRALRFAGRPDSVAVRSITRFMREAIEEMK